MWQHLDSMVIPMTFNPFVTLQYMRICWWLRVLTRNKINILGGKSRDNVILYFLIWASEYQFSTETEEAMDLVLFILNAICVVHLSVYIPEGKRKRQRTRHIFGSELKVCPTILQQQLFLLIREDRESFWPIDFSAERKFRGEKGPKRRVKHSPAVFVSALCFCAEVSGL